MRKLKLLFLSIGVFVFSNSFSQSVTPAILNASGGTYVFGPYRVEWSFGEAMAVETMTNATSSNIIVTNGVLQPGTHNPATNITTGVWDAEEIKILPNPVQNVVEIDFFSKQKGKMNLTFFDTEGRTIATRQFDYFGVGRIELWNISTFPAGAYFLNIQLTPTGTSIAKKGAFKVIKVN
jgi:hypothetical protein